MPAVSFYLNQDALENVKARAKAFNLPVSRIIREAVESYLEIKKQKEARKRVLKLLTEKKPFGGEQAWMDIHQERTIADADRG
ncbi:MAG: ribbon-helix-helix domain-containing protein [Candidatus Aminicenantes bacterium]|nr:ribbon-helix-helix domain-containing protein [Candidatus Aminicenantes bacterium]